MYSKNVHRRSQPVLSLLSIGTVLKARGHEVRYLDTTIEGIDFTFPFDDKTDCYGINNDIILSTAISYCPDVIGISCLSTSQFPQCVKIAKKLKQLKVPIVIGGNYPSTNTQEILKYDCFDSIVIGEGEKAFVDNIEKLPRICKAKSYVILDDLPHIDWSLAPIKKYWEEGLPQAPFPKSRKSLPYESSRGCPEKCIFCSTREHFGKTYRFKSAPNVIDEITKMAEFGTEEIQFIDDNIALKGKRFLDICEGLAPLKLHLCVPSGIRFDYFMERDIKEVFKKMKKAGFYQITFPIESADEYILNKVINKRLDLARMYRTVRLAKEFGFNTHSFFILGLPYETRQQMNRTIKYMEELKTDGYSISLAQPLPGTELHKWCRRDGLLKEGLIESDFLFGEVTIKRLEEPFEKELKELLENVAKRVNTNNKE